MQSCCRCVCDCDCGCDYALLFGVNSTFQGSLLSADDLVFDGFSTIFVSSPSLRTEAQDLARADHAVVVPAWSLPRVVGDDADGGGAASCSDGRDGAVPAFFFEMHPLHHNSVAASSSSSSQSRSLSLCFPNEHLPHPLEQLQPCVDSGASAVVLLRMPLLVVDAISLSKAGMGAGLRSFSADKEDLDNASDKCMAAAVAASKNGAYM
jgi:hypothetical protein